MLKIIQCIEAYAEQLPRTGGVSSTVDPEPMLKITRYLHHGFVLTEQCLAYYHSRREPAADWADLEAPPEAPRSKPWIAYDTETWSARAEALRVVLVNQYDPLSRAYSDFSPLAADRSRQYRASEFVYFLIARIEMCAYATRSNEVRERMASRRPSDLQYIAQNELITEDSKILSMPCSRVLESMRHLFRRIVTMRYNIELEFYWDLLEHRMQRLILYAGTELDHDVEDMRSKPVVQGGTPLYAGNSKLLSTVTICAAALHRRFYMARMFEHAEPRPYEHEEELSTAVRAWFLRKCKSMTSRQSSKSVRERTLDSNLMPGEMELYRFEYPRDEDGVLVVLSRNRGAAFQRMVDDAGMPVANIIEKELPNCPVGQSEPIVLQYALLELTELSMRHSCEGAMWFDHASIEADMDVQLDDLMRTDRPRVTQIFNHWQLVYQKKAYMYNSYMRAFAAWFDITYRDFGGHLTQRITLDEWAEEIFGRELYYAVLKKQQPPPLMQSKALFSI